MSFRDELETVSKRYVENFIRGDAAACASAYAEDGEKHHSLHKRDRGRAAIEAGFSKLMADGVTVTKLTTIWADASGDLGCAIQTFDSAAGARIVMLALKREDGGAWKVIREVMVPD
jgi:ketosteroid isomerase-like protein